METVQNIVAGVYILLQGGIGRLSQNELDFNDVLEVGTDVMRGFMRDAGMAHREHHSMSADVVLTLDSAGVDYLLAVPSVPDFEPTELTFSVHAGGQTGWRNVDVVSLSALGQYPNSGRVYGAFIGSTYTPDGLKVRLNISPEDVAGRMWRMTFRVPLVTQLQMGERPPLPVEFMRMVKLAWAIACMPLVKVPDEKLARWNSWEAKTLPKYAAELLGWNNPNNPSNPGRWQDYLNGGVGCYTQEVPRFDSHRRGGRGSMRGVVGVGGAWGRRE